MVSWRNRTKLNSMPLWYPLAQCNISYTYIHIHIYIYTYIVLCLWMCHCFRCTAGGLATTSGRRLSLGSSNLPYHVGTLGATSQDSPTILYTQDRKESPPPPHLSIPSPQVLRDSPSKVVGDSCYPRLSLRWPGTPLPGTSFSLSTRQFIIALVGQHRLVPMPLSCILKKHRFWEPPKGPQNRVYI